MALQHGWYIEERPTSLGAPLVADSAIACVIGASPVNQTKVGGAWITEAQILAGLRAQPELCPNMQEARAKVGYLGPREDAHGVHRFDCGISAQLRASFALYGAGPIVAINVLGNSAEHVQSGTAEIKLDRGAIPREAQTLPLSMMIVPSLVVSGDDGPFVEGQDYLADFDTEGRFELILTAGSAIAPDATITLAFDYLDPSKVDAEDIEGAIDAEGVRTGLEAVYSVPMATRKIPCTILAPFHSGDPVTAAILGAKCENIAGTFRAIGLIDSFLDDALTTTPAQKKAELGLVSENLIFTPYDYRTGDEAIPASCHWAAMMAVVDGANGGVPSISPSNEPLQVTAVFASDAPDAPRVSHGRDEANLLNEAGIATARNTVNAGWVTWGNYTTAYPASTDPKDTFIPIRRMFNWVANTLQLTFENRIDKRLRRGLVQEVVDVANTWLESLEKDEDMIGAEVLFTEERNPPAQLAAGKAIFGLKMAPPPPLQAGIFEFEYEAGFLTRLFGE